jgi:hypothetical protein
MLEQVSEVVSVPDGHLLWVKDVAAQGAEGDAEEQEVKAWNNYKRNDTWWVVVELVEGDARIVHRIFGVCVWVILVVDYKQGYQKAEDHCEACEEYHKHSDAGIDNHLLPEIKALPSEIWFICKVFYLLYVQHLIVLADFVWEKAPGAGLLCFISVFVGVKGILLSTISLAMSNNKVKLGPTPLLLSEISRHETVPGFFNLSWFWCR